MTIKSWMISPRKHKKYRVILSDGRKIDFGDDRFAQYKDSSPLKAYKHLDHLDKKRRSHYYARHSIDYPKYSADWLSKRFLW